MSIQEYLENLNRLKRLAVSRWGSLSSLERDVLDGAFEWLVDNLEIKRGEIKVDEDLARIMDEFVRAVVDTVNNVPLYQSNLKRFLQDLTTIQNNNKLFHSTTNNFDIETAGVTGVQKAVVNEIIDQYTGNGLNAHFAAPLKDGIFRNILAGANMKEVKEVLRNYILGGQDKSGKLGQYLDQTAMMAVDSYTGAINQQLVNDFTFTGYIISGSLIETSSKQCIQAVEMTLDENGYMNFDEWEKILDIARNNPKARLIPGTTIKNLPLNKLHWGCRHDFTPVIMAKDLKKQPPKKKEEPIVEKPPVQQQPPAQPKPVEKPVPIPAKKSPYKEAKSKNEAKQVVKDILEQNVGLKVTKVTVSSTLPLETLNKQLAELQRLTNLYKITPAVDLSKGTEISFKSTSRLYGVVKSSFQGRYLNKINFGDQTDNTANRQRKDPAIDFTRTKSVVDPDKAVLATTTHEYAHVTALSYQSTYNQASKDFFAELAILRKEYHEELKAINEKNNSEKEYSEIFLGKYASTNLNEFMAEAFTEYQLSSNPSKYAKKVGLLIDKYFKK